MSRKPKLLEGDEALIYAALGSHIEALEGFLSDTEPGDEVDVVRDELAAAKQLRERFKP